MIQAARELEAAGVDFIIITTNTMHIVFDQIQENITVPMLSLLDAVGRAISERGIKTVGLLGTKFTMEKDFYFQALAKMGIEVLVPDKDDREYVNSVIYSELVAGEIRDDSRDGYLAVFEKLVKKGAEGIILGCTEIPLLVKAGDVDLPLFDTTTIHAKAALDYAVQEVK